MRCYDVDFRVELRASEIINRDIKTTNYHHNNGVLYFHVIDKSEIKFLGVRSPGFKNKVVKICKTYAGKYCDGHYIIADSPHSIDRFGDLENISIIANDDDIYNDDQITNIILKNKRLALLPTALKNKLIKNLKKVIA